MTTETIIEAAHETAADAHEQAAEIIQDAHETAGDITESVAEQVQDAAEQVAELTETITDQQKELEWKTATQSQLAELTAKLATLEHLPATIQANHQALMDQLIPATTPSHADADALAELQSAEPQAPETIAEPESQAETQSPPKRKHQFL